MIGQAPTQDEINQRWSETLDWARKTLTEVASELLIWEPHMVEPINDDELDRLDAVAAQMMHQLVDEVCVGVRAAKAQSLAMDLNPARD